jgi:hypothetical protein
MELLEMESTTAPVFQPAIAEDAELAARRSLRSQIARLERELSDAFVTTFTFSMGGLGLAPAGLGQEPRMLGLGELEQIRDELAERVRAARLTISERAEAQAASRVCLERMLLEPGKYRFTRISRRDLGEPGCGVWAVRPRLGLIGMLMGWWQVKLSSGCPLPGGRGLTVAARSTQSRPDAPRPEDGHRRGIGRADHVRRQSGALGRHAAALALGRITDPGRH